MANAKDGMPEEVRKASKNEGVPIEAFDVLLSTDGTATFSWNTPDIQTLAKLLGEPEFDPPRWCG